MDLKRIVLKKETYSNRFIINILNTAYNHRNLYSCTLKYND
jgi:hypothetical protein